MLSVNDILDHDHFKRVCVLGYIGAAALTAMGPKKFVIKVSATAAVLFLILKRC